MLSLLELYRQRQLLSLSIQPNFTCFMLYPNTCTRWRCFSSSAIESFPNENAYEILGVPQTSSFAEIKATFRELAKKTHPDLAESKGDSSAAERFIQILAAYEVLFIICSLLPELTSMLPYEYVCCYFRQWLWNLAIWQINWCRMKKKLWMMKALERWLEIKADSFVKQERRTYILCEILVHSVDGKFGLEILNYEHFIDMRILITRISACNSNSYTHRWRNADMILTYGNSDFSI